MISSKLTKGCLLVADPSLAGNDIEFSRTVVLLADHTKQGSIGFILNKQLSYTIQDLVPEVHSTIKVYTGGPVEQDNLYFIHNVPNLIPNSIEISDGIYWGGDFETTCQLLNEQQINYKNIRFFLGYSGWTSGQLEDELEENVWIVAGNKFAKKIIATAPNQLWKKQLLDLGGDYVIWSNAPDDPMLN